ncbi:MAG TPA: glycosyltransferase family 4 protein [Polyangiaceae bacterium]
MTDRARRPLRLAVYGVLSESAGSSAAAYPVLMAELLERGHAVEFFGNPSYVRPRTLERYPNYRFHPLHIEAMERLWYRTEASEFARAAVAQLGIAAYQREAIRQIERESERERFDLILCTDMQPLWSAKLPLVGWPQGPPHTEGAALRSSELARLAVRSLGAKQYLAIQGFYAYRMLASRLALGAADTLLCGSRWAGDEWIRFGAEPVRVRPIPYPVDTAAFSRVPALEPRATTTFLWLGRSVPRKRLDLFVAAFERLRRRYPNVRARIVGDVLAHPFGRAVLEGRSAIPGLSIEGGVARESVPQLFGDVDVLVQPSQSENFGFSLAEALAAGRPVVGGPTNGTFEYAGEGGFGFSEYSAESVASAMERAMLAATNLGPELSRRAREAASIFAIASVTERVLAACDDVLARRAVSGRRRGTVL